ncbi:MAG: undecaprenyldiphospho-muramoylpentapeptide beta-N-acetylglucosaminyltransferase [Cytophagaceae bacterium]
MKNNGKPYRIIISGGGTGGHIFPAIAIANEFKAQHPDTEVLFVGANGRMEMQRVPDAGYKIIGLNIAGIQRRLTLENLKFPFKVIASLWKARSVVKEFQPDVAIGVGGYASWPLLWSAKNAGVPIVIQEQNSYAGVANKSLASNASAICVAYDQMERFFPKGKIAITGNPVRSTITQTLPDKSVACAFFGLSPLKKTVLVIGGSLGARTINEALALSHSSFVEKDIQIIWQTGKFYIEKYQSLQAADVKVMDFIKDMNMAYAAADVIISRAGALSIAELCIIGKPVVLVPSPNVAEDHQTKNAMALVTKNAAILVKDSEAKEKLVKETLALLADDSKQAVLSSEIKKLGKPNATVDIVHKIKEVIS